MKLALGNQFVNRHICQAYYHYSGHPQGVLYILFLKGRCPYFISNFFVVSTEYQALGTYTEKGSDIQKKVEPYSVYHARFAAVAAARPSAIIPCCR